MSMNSVFVPLFLKIMLLLLTGMAAFAQPFPGQWVDDLYLTYNPLNSSLVRFIDRNNVERKAIPDISSITDFPVPHNFRHRTVYTFWHNDGLHMLTYGDGEKNKDESPFRRYTFAKWQDDEWHFLGSYNGPDRISLTAIPCDNDRFIVVSTTDLTNSKSQNRTPFVRMTLLPDKKELRIASSIDHGQDEIRKFMQETTCFNLAWESYPIMTDGYLTLLNFNTGLYWIFSLETASLRRTGNIFNKEKVKPEWVAKGGLRNAILCAHPEKDGTILVSTLMEEAFTTETDPTREATELLNQGAFGGKPGSATFNPRDAIIALNKRIKEFAERNPFIVWYRIHPEQGKVEKLSMPPEGAALDREGGKNDFWYPLPDGSVKMGSRKIVEPKKVEATTAEQKK